MPLRTRRFHYPQETGLRGPVDHRQTKCASKLVDDWMESDPNVAYSGGKWGTRHHVRLPMYSYCTRVHRKRSERDFVRSYECLKHCMSTRMMYCRLRTVVYRSAKTRTCSNSACRDFFLKVQWSRAARSGRSLGWERTKAWVHRA